MTSFRHDDVIDTGVMWFPYTESSSVSGSGAPEVQQLYSLFCDRWRLEFNQTSLQLFNTTSTEGKTAKMSLYPSLEDMTVGKMAKVNYGVDN